MIGIRSQLVRTDVTAQDTVSVKGDESVVSVTVSAKTDTLVR